MVATGDRGTTERVERRQRHMAASPMDQTLIADEVNECNSSDCHLSVCTHYLTAAVTLFRPSSVVPLSSHTTVLRMCR